MHVPDVAPDMFFLKEYAHPIDIVKLVDDELLPQAKGAVHEVVAL